jgi:hypothetical protein
MSQVAGVQTTDADDAGGTAAAASDGEPAPDEAAPGEAGAWGWARLAGVDRFLWAAIALGVVLRFWGLGAQSLWYDEWLSAEAASGTLAHLRRYVTDQAGIPPTYFAVMWGWARVFGDGDAALRVPSALLGVATVPVMYAAAREWCRSRRVARMAALLTAVHPMLVWYSQEARPYSLLALVAALSLLSLGRFRARGERRDLLQWALACAVMIAVHYFAVFLVAAEALALLLLRRPRWREVLAACWPAAIVLLVLSPFAVQQFSRRSNHSWITTHRLVMRLSDAGHTALVGPGPFNGRMWMIVAAVAAVAVALALVRGNRRERQAAIVGVAVGSVSVGLAIGANVFGVDMVLARYLIGSLVLGIVVVAIGLGAARVPRVIGWSGVAVLGAASLVTVVADARDPHLQRADWRAVAAAHEAGGTTTGARLLVMNLHDYLGGPLFRYLDGARPVDDEPVIVDQIDILVAKQTPKPCNLFVGLECGLVFLGAPPPEPLASQLTLDERIDLDQFVIERYRTDGPIRVVAADMVPDRDRSHSLVVITGHG